VGHPRPLQVTLHHSVSASLSRRATHSFSVELCVCVKGAAAASTHPGEVHEEHLDGGHLVRAMQQLILTDAVAVTDVLQHCVTTTP
jgi:hypothetical protein